MNIPAPSTTNIANPPPIYGIISSNKPVEIPSKTEASSISSSPGFWLSGVESLSGTSLSL